MVQDSFIRDKLLVLYMLRRIDEPINIRHIYDFFSTLKGEDYFSLNELLTELSERSLISLKSDATHSFCSITDDGTDTFESLENILSYYHKNMVDEYLRENHMRIRNETSVSSNYYKTANGDFESHLCIKERKRNLIDIKLSMPSEKLAAAVCAEWQEKNADIYKELTKKLLG